MLERLDRLAAPLLAPEVLRGAAWWVAGTGALFALFLVQDGAAPVAWAALAVVFFAPALLAMALARAIGAGSQVAGPLAVALGTLAMAVGVIILAASPSAGQGISGPGAGWLIPSLAAAAGLLEIAGGIAIAAAGLRMWRAGGGAGGRSSWSSGEG